MYNENYNWNRYTYIYKPVYSNGKVCLLIQYFPAYSEKTLFFLHIFAISILCLKWYLEEYMINIGDIVCDHPASQYDVRANMI